MKLITDTWRGLVRRKLWPVALLLVGALAAVPLTLAKEPEPVLPPANAALAADEGLPETFVTASTDESTDTETATKRRRTLGASKDPFEPAELPKVKKKKKAKLATEASEPEAPVEQPMDTSASGGAGADAPVVPEATPTPTATPKPAPANSVRVRFSTTENADDAGSKTVRKLDVLPDAENPLVVFRGLENKGKVAVFELTGTVTVEGDGDCEPSPEVCQVVRLRAGETVFITVADTGEATDAQYQLDVVKINR